MNGTLFRGIRTLPIGTKDFLSQAEIDRNNCDDQDCEAWGLSVWVTLFMFHKIDEASAPYC